MWLTEQSSNRDYVENLCGLLNSPIPRDYVENQSELLNSPVTGTM